MALAFVGDVTCDRCWAMDLVTFVSASVPAGSMHDSCFVFTQPKSAACGRAFGGAARCPPEACGSNLPDPQRSSSDVLIFVGRPPLFMGSIFAERY
jgi:hypothetical protein